VGSSGSNDHLYPKKKPFQSQTRANSPALSPLRTYMASAWYARSM
jgi:hypothetical protein